jgi:rubrerythrin/VIT1/CCC1 family predicted Fe2+/Mn2+ transporter
MVRSAEGRTSSRTEANLLVAFAGEADANRRYLAYGIQALHEGRPEIAQLFFEAAGAETIHALNHLGTMNAVGSTRENLERAAVGEMEEIEIILPRMIREAEEGHRPDAAASFRLALERERHHRDMFRLALAEFDGAQPGRASPVSATASSVRPTPGGAGPRVPTPPIGGGHGVGELATEPERIGRLSSIREVVFGAQDGLVSTFAVVAGLAAAEVGHLVVLLGGLVSAVAGVLSMSIGTFLSSRAQQQVYEAELARERREIHDHPGEEVAELMAALMARGMSRGDAADVTRRVGRHPDLLLAMLGLFELGLVPQRMGTPIRDAFVMAVAFAVASLVPLVPFAQPRVLAGLGVSAALTVIALFVVGVLKARVARISGIRSGLEVVSFGIASGAIGFALGRVASLLLGVEIR